MGIDERGVRNFPKRWTGLTSVGTNQATAFLLLAGGYHEFTAVASGTGASLPVITPDSRETTISNNGANALLVYPPSGGTIDTAGSSVSLAAGSSATYWATSPTNWQDRVTGGSGGGGGSPTITEVSQTASFTATANSFYAISGSSAVTATLPTAVGIAGQTVRFRCVAGYTGLCTITGTGGQTIGGAATRIICTGESPLLQSDGANWVRTGGTIIPCACRIYLGTNQPITATSDVLANLDTVSFDNTGQMAVTASHQIKALRPGRYRMSFSAYYTGMTNQIYQMYINPNKNGAGTPILIQPTVPASTLGTSFSFDANATQTLAAGDLITMHVSVTNTGSTSTALTSGETTGMEVVEVPSW